MDDSVKICDIVVSNEVLPHDLELRFLNNYPPYNSIFKADENLVKIACETCEMCIRDSYEGAKPRKVLITKQQWAERRMNKKAE